MVDVKTVRYAYPQSPKTGIHISTIVILQYMWS